MEANVDLLISEFTAVYASFKPASNIFEKPHDCGHDDDKNPRNIPDYLIPEIDTLSCSERQVCIPTMNMMYSLSIFASPASSTVESQLLRHLILMKEVTPDRGILMLSFDEGIGVSAGFLLKVLNSFGVKKKVEDSETFQLWYEKRTRYSNL